MRLVLHPGIALDVSQIMEYYEAVAGAELAADFFSELTHFFDKALEYPLAYRVRSHDLRRVDLKRFPFHFWFRFIPPGTVRVLVIRHHKQKPVGRADDELLSSIRSIEGVKFIPVESRMILAVRYNEKTRDMDVIFRTGEKYRYKGVPPLEFQGLVSARSHGQYMHKRILNRYDYDSLD